MASAKNVLKTNVCVHDCAKQPPNTCSELNQTSADVKRRLPGLSSSPGVRGCFSIAAGCASWILMARSGWTWLKYVEPDNQVSPAKNRRKYGGYETVGWTNIDAKWWIRLTSFNAHLEHNGSWPPYPMRRGVNPADITWWYRLRRLLQYHLSFLGDSIPFKFHGWVKLNPIMIHLNLPSGKLT